MNMNDWIAGYLSGSSRKPIPVLSFPGAQLIGAAVDELVRSGRRQADCMKAWNRPKRFLYPTSGQDALGNVCVP